LLTLLVLFFSGGFGLPVGVPPEPVDPVLGQIAPDECLFYTAWAGMAEPEAASKNRTERLLAEPEVQPLISAVTDQLGAALQRAAAGERDPAARLAAEVGPQLLTTLLTRPTALFVSDDEFPLTPAWCLAENELVIALFPQAVKAYLSRGEEFQSLAQQPAVSRLLQSDAPPLAVTYVDTQQVFRTVYPVVQILAQIGLHQAQREGLDLSPVVLPSGGSIEQHLLPLLAAVRRTESGVETISHQTLPSANLAAAAPLGVALLLPAVQAAREAARRAESANNLKRIGLAMHNFHDAHRHFPAAYNADKQGKPLLSWRVHLLPFLEQAPLYNQFHLDEPWDSEHNRKLIAQMPAVYRSPNSREEAGKTNYVGIRGEDMVFVAPKGKGPQGTRWAGTSMRDILDGTSNTILVVEASDAEAVIWTKPEDFEPDEQNPLRGLVGLRPNGFQALFCDGSVRFIAESVDRDVLRALFTRADGQAVDLP
jgi:hypothetical protein